MNENGKRDRDELVVIALAGGSTYAEAAAVAGVSKATVARRMSEPDFRRQVAEARKQIIDRVRGSLTEAAPKVADGLVVLATEAMSESVRLRASTRLLELVLRRRPGLDAVSVAEVETIVEELVEIALRHLPVEAHEGYIREVRAIAE